MLAYFITDFDFKKDTGLDYPLKYRDISYSEKELFEYLKFILRDFYCKYRKKTENPLSYDDFYNEYGLVLEVGVVSLNHRAMITYDDYDAYLRELKTVRKEDFPEFLLSYTDCCRFWFDHRLKLKYVYSFLLNFGKHAEMELQFAFSYKALFPEKYHVSQYKDGDRVRYEGRDYIVHASHTSEFIYDAENPLDCLWGYSLFEEDGISLQDSKWSYFVVDEDLERLPDVSKVTTKKHIDLLCEYVFNRFHKYTDISNIDDGLNETYTKLIRSDKFLTVVLKTSDEDIELRFPSHRSLFSFLLFNGETPIVYVIGFISLVKDCYVEEISVKYNGNVIDVVPVHQEFKQGEAINISRYIKK